MPDDEQDAPAEPDWDTVLHRWEADLERADWVTLAEAVAATGVSRSALRAWYRKGEVPSTVEDGPHGPQRLVSLEAVAERVARSPRLGFVRTSPPASAPDPVAVLREQLERAEARAERAEAALRDALVRAARAEAERDLLREERDRPRP